MKQAASGPTEFALIIGAMKSGTTSLFELLAQHPEISACSVKEPSFYSSEAITSEGWKDYVGLWQWDPSKHKVALEASTSYSKAPFKADVPERIHARSDAAFRFIYLMRNPIQRIASQVRHSLYEGWGQTLDAGMTDDLIAFSQYAMQIDKYMDWFPRDSMLLLTLEELKERPDSVLRRVCEFLGVASDWEFVGREKPRNQGQFFEVPMAVRLLAKNRLARGLVDLLPDRARRSLRESLGKLAGRVGDDLGRWQLNADEEKQVLDLLAEDLRRLSSVYGVDVGRYWGIPASLLAT